MSVVQQNAKKKEVSNDNNNIEKIEEIKILDVSYYYYFTSDRYMICIYGNS